ncbi:MAG: hypothetical protein K0R66_400 [Gammaproteobacteria bacterium]|jgi:cob(I)alamin adenosyltransferase/energy-coupling factor transporter ATP-binding protein EcfA2|nr:hypothetical protein [Gammaproteobacteria bacterium]
MLGMSGITSAVSKAVGISGGRAEASSRPKEAAKVDTVSWENKVLKGGVPVIDVLLGSPPSKTEPEPPSLVKAVEKTKASFGKDVILFIGPTGAGKSTTINYLLRHALEEDVLDDGETILKVVENKEKKSAKMGTTVESCTTYPESFSEPGSPFSYCDCPGFFDTRPKERIITNMSIDMVAKSARKVQGIVLLLEDAALFGQKAAGFRELVATLRRLIKDLDKKTPREIDQLKASMMVVYNPKGNLKRNEKHIYTRLAKLIESEQPKLDELKARLQAAPSEEIISAFNESASSLSMMKMIKDLIEAKRFAIMNPMDEGESREQILSCLHASAGVAKDMLSFSDMDPAQQRMNQVMLDIAGEANLLLMNQKLAQDELHRLEARIPEIENELKGLRKQLELASAKGSTFLENIEKSRRETLSSLETNLKLKADKEKEAALLKTEVDKLKRELQDIDNNTPVKCWEHSHLVETSDKVARAGTAILGFLTSLPFTMVSIWVAEKTTEKAMSSCIDYMMTKTVRYSGIPYNKAEYTDGLIGSEKDCDKANGEFTYDIDIIDSKPGRHYIRLFTEKRLMPGNQQRIAVLKKTLGIDKDGRVIGEVQDKSLREESAAKVIILDEKGNQSQGGKLNQLQRLIAEIANLSKSISQAQKYITDLTSDSSTMQAATERRRKELEEQIQQINRELSDIKMVHIPAKHEILAENEARFTKSLQVYKVVQYIVMALCLDTNPDPQYQQVIPEFLAGLSRKGVHPEFAARAEPAPAAGGAGAMPFVGHAAKPVHSASSMAEDPSWAVF